MRKLIPFVTVGMIAGVWATLHVPAGGLTPPQVGAGGPVVYVGEGPATSPPLRDLIPDPPREGPLQAVPLGLTNTPLLGSGPPLPDSALQDWGGPSLAAGAPLFPGISNLDNLIPPDSNASVGNSQVVETVNDRYQVFNTSGSSLAGPNYLTTLYANLANMGGAGPNCTKPDSAYDYDPVVLYDKAAGRWLVTAVAGNTTGSSGTECVAVSKTSDATGSYWLYAFPFSANNDYPKFGVWPDAYYASYNMFNPLFQGAQVCAYNRSAMLSGGTATAVCFQRSTSDASLLPSDLDGSTAPPSGEPDFYLEIADSSHLNLYRFHVDFSTPSNSTFTGPISVAVASFSEPCTACIPQEGTTQQLEALPGRLMHRLAYRHFNDHESLVVTHTVTAGSSSGVRWYEIRSPNGTPSVYQQGTYAPDSNWRWMGSASMDGEGDIAVGYSISSSSMYPSIAYAVRIPSDPLGTLERENTLVSGTGYQYESGQNVNRWGDYTSMAIDPSSDATFYYTNEYYSTPGTNWQTNIGSMPPPTASVSPTSLTLISQYNNPAYGTATLTNNGTWTIVINSITVSGPYFSLSSTTCGTSLTQGSSCSATVEFNPGGCVTPQTGELVFDDSAVGGAQTVSLTGETVKCTTQPPP